MALPTAVPTSPSLPLDHSGPWTEAEFLSLPDGSRVELLDGTLIVSPRGNLRHQFLGPAIWHGFHAARRPGWRVVGEFDVRVGRDRVFIPDVSVVRDSIGLDEKIADAADVALVVEIASPSTVLLDRHVKTRAYAEAGIERFLRVEFAAPGPVAELLALDDDGVHRLARRAEPGETLQVDRPFPVTLDLAALLAQA